MHRQKVILKSRLSGITSAPRVELPAAPPDAQKTNQPAAAPVTPVRDEPALRNLLAEWSRIVKEVQSRELHTLAEVAQMSVELGVAIAERLIAGEIAADRQRLERIVLATLERMPAARFVVVRGHPDDLALLQKLVQQQPDMERYRDLMTFRPEPTLQRGQIKLEADEWFAEWDTPRSLADVRAALLEETFMDE